MNAEQQEVFKEKLLKLFNTTEEAIKEDPEAFKATLKKHFESATGFFQHAASANEEDNAQAQSSMALLIDYLKQQNISVPDAIEELPEEIKKWFGGSTFDELIKQASSTKPEEQKNVLAGFLRKIADDIEAPSTHQIPKEKIKADISSALKDQLNNLDFKL